MSTSDNRICKMVLPLTSPPPVHQASCLLIHWHSLPCRRTFYKTISSREENICASKRAIKSNQALLWCGEWSSPRVSVILWLSISYAKLPLFAFVLSEQYEFIESVLGPSKWQVNFFIQRYGNMLKKNAMLIFKHMFFIIWSKYPIFQLSKHISSILVLSLNRDEN